MRGEQSSARLVPAASRTVAILRLLSRASRPMNLSEIAGTLEIVPSSCLHILRVLVAESLVNVDPSTKRYRLGIGVLSLARSVLAKDPLADFLRTELEDVSSEFRVSSVATKLEGDRAISIATAVPQNAFAINTEVGSRYPIYMSSTGRCVAAFGDIGPEKMVRLLGKGRWAKLPDPATWLAEVEECRRRGYAVDREDYITGITVVAVPVFDRGGVLTHTLGVISVSEVADRLGIDRLADALIAVANRARVLGGE